MRINTDIMRVLEFQRRRLDIFVEHRSKETVKHRRCEIFVEVEGQNVEPTSPVGVTSGICRSYGAWYCLGIGFYKDATPTAFGISHATMASQTVIQKTFEELSVL
jgi:hypothetical protein